MRNLCLTIALSLACSAAAAPPQRVEVAYEVARNGSVLGEVSLRLTHDGRSYRLAETWKGKGIYALRGEVTRSSRGSVAPDGLRPQKFEEHTPGKETRHADFDPAATTATLLRQDRLSVVWTMAFAPPRETVTMSVADGKNVKPHTYEVAGRERVKTPAGEFNALKLVKRKDKADDRGMEIWLAADRNYLPVRTLTTAKDGSRIDQVAVKITVQ
jgi:hypothetical protein